MIGNIICNNNSSGIYNGHELSHSKYINNTIYNNYYPYFGCGIDSWGAHVVIENNLIWNNTDKNSSNQEEVQGHNGLNYVNYNNIKTEFDTGINISEEPMIIDPTNGQGIDFDALNANWQLDDNSPCVNAGNPETSEYDLPEFDYYGNIRIYGGRVDMGASENQFVVNINDIMPKNDINIFPNPCNDFINIETETKIENINIFDINGRLVLTKKYNSSIQKNYEIDCSGLKQGIYYLNIMANNKKVSSNTIIIQ